MFRFSIPLPCGGEVVLEAGREPDAPEPEPPFSNAEIRALYYTVSRAQAMAESRRGMLSCPPDCAVCTEAEREFARAAAALQRVFPDRRNP